MFLPKLLQADITTLPVDAVVNAANESLLGGGGVDGAIHLAAGPRLREYCRTLGGCPTGQAKLTPGFGLKAKWIIHTVGPVWRNGREKEAELLASCYRNSLALCAPSGIKTIAFPAVSCGIYGYPLDEAARIAMTEFKTYIAAGGPLEKITMVLFGADAFRAFSAARKESFWD
jgi:O-acetyl-ADP-ribose deacetylase (regulator of RNase III)